MFLGFSGEIADLLLRGSVVLPTCGRLGGIVCGRVGLLLGFRECFLCFFAFDLCGFGVSFGGLFGGFAGGLLRFAERLGELALGPLGCIRRGISDHLLFGRG